MPSDNGGHHGGEAPSHVEDEQHDDGHGTGHHSHDHDHHAHDLGVVGAAVVTISSTRTVEDDPAGDVIISCFEKAGHDVVVRELVPDEYDRVQSIVDRLVGRKDVDVIVTSGGTGVTPDDVTVEAVEPLFEKKLPGFGELFRRLSYDEIGARVVGTRATAGVANSVTVFCLPGSENAVRLGCNEIIVPEVDHLAGLAQRTLDTAGEGDGDLGRKPE